MAQNALQVSWNLSKTTAFKQKIIVAAVRAAIAVQAEDTGTANHTERAALANKILLNPTSEGARFALPVASDPSGVAINIETSDADLLYTVNSLFNAMALGGA